MTYADPAQLARQVHDTAAELARCLATDVRVDPVQVFVPLLSATLRLREIAEELSRAATSVDEPAARAAHRAGELFAAAGHQLTVAVSGLRDPRATDTG
ncbi:hypothetical protein [Phytohabitans rumicis]|uniref:hypothetical protein n=1 Tax=Phytohabitans rumicis TaxID=1076125 RepID=UPI0015676636|nr:hypothetical protein [Phytohabitans rumicis]